MGNTNEHLSVNELFQETNGDTIQLEEGKTYTLKAPIFITKPIIIEGNNALLVGSDENKVGFTLAGSGIKIRKLQFS